MKVSDLFYDLSVGPLSNLALGNDGNGTIREKDHGKLISYINSALDELYGKFLLSSKELILMAVGNITSYTLTKEYALSTNANVPYQYIMDTKEKPFTGDLIRIIAVYDYTGRSFSLNDTGNRNSLFTPSPVVLQIPFPVTGATYSVVYQAKHPKLHAIGLSTDQLLDQEIFLPEFLKNALVNYVCYMVYSHMNGAEHTAKGQEYITLYSMQCDSVEEQDLMSQTQSTTHTKLNERGFV